MKAGKRIGYLGLSLLALVSAIGVQLVASIVVMLPVTFVAGFQAGMQGIEDMEVITQMSNDAVAAAMPLMVLVAHIGMVLTFALWYRFGCGRPSLKNVDLKQVFAPKKLAAMVLIAVGLCIFTNFALVLVYPIIPESVVETYETMMENVQMGESPLAIFAAVCLAPIGEELACRGVIFYYAKKAVSGMKHPTAAFWIANCVQAFLFGVMHGNLLQGTYAFILGLVLGYMAHHFKSILPAMLGHFLFNGVSSFAMEPISSALPESNVVYGVIVAVCAVVIAGGFYLGGATKEKPIVA
ncbi:MAG: CPBP family intramembrane metalloprotease [Lachnospiraceae bacterium]|nr:CPBP family intramembrane metalloprotease [Lachnospiraceae bacterium]